MDTEKTYTLADLKVWDFPGTAFGSNWATDQTLAQSNYAKCSY